jgi:hypothetical protein
MAAKTRHTGAVRKRRERKSGSARVSLEDETESSRRRVRRLPKIKGEELVELTVLTSRPRRYRKK